MRFASVIVTSYNYANYLRQSIDSALGQTHRYTEVIVVDDGSTDASTDIIASYGDRIRPILKSNSGQASGLNAGFRASRGDCIVFLDSDDILFPTAIEEALPHLQRPGVAKVHWPLAMIDNSGRSTGSVVRPDVAEGDFREVVLARGPYSYAWPPTSGNAWARCFLDSVLPMPEQAYRTCPDLYLSALAPLFGKIARVDHPLAQWRDHGDNASYRASFLERLQDHVDRDDQAIGDLAAYCNRLGLASRPGAWRANSWWHQVKVAVEQIEKHIPTGSTFILVDQDEWGLGSTFAERRKLPYPERSGEYSGLPADDRAAILELDRLRRGGARYIVFAPNALWWLMHYDGLSRHLDANFKRVTDGSSAVIFDIGSQRSV